MFLSKFNLYSDSYKFILAAEKIGRRMDFKPFRLGPNGMIYSELQETLFFKWLYPVLIAALKTFGIESFTAAHLISFTCGLLAIPAIFLLIKEFYNTKGAKANNRIAVITLSVLLFSGSRLLWSSIIVSDTLNLLLITLFLWILLGERVSISGLLLALAIFNKPENIILIIPALITFKKSSELRELSGIPKSKFSTRIAAKFLLATTLPLIFLYSMIFIIIRPDPLSIIKPALNQITYPRFLISTLGIDGLTILAGVSGLIALIIKKNRKGVVIALSALLLAIIYYIHNPYQERYLVALLPMLCVGADYSINWIYDLLIKRAGRSWLISAGFVLILLSLGTFQLKTAFNSLPKMDYEQELALKVKAIAANTLPPEEKPTLITQRVEPYYLFTRFSTHKFLNPRPHIPHIPQPKIVIIDEGVRLARPEVAEYFETNYPNQKIAEIPTESEFRTTTKKYKPQKPVELYLIP